MSLLLSVKNSAGVARNLRAFEARLTRGVKRATRESALNTRNLVQATCAYDTGFMSEHVKAFALPEGGGLAYEVGWADADFEAAEKPFYPPYVEFGTSRMAAQPSLAPAAAVMRPRLMQGIVDAVRNAAVRGERV